MINMLHPPFPWFHRKTQNWKGQMEKSIRDMAVSHWGVDSKYHQVFDGLHLYLKGKCRTLCIPVDLRISGWETASKGLSHYRQLPMRWEADDEQACNNSSCGSPLSWSVEDHRVLYQELSCALTVWPLYRPCQAPGVHGWATFWHEPQDYFTLIFHSYICFLNELCNGLWQL